MPPVFKPSKKIPARLITIGALFLFCLLCLSLLITVLTQTVDDAPDSSQKPQKVFNAEHYNIDNGLELVVIPNHRAGVVTHMVWYKVGAADEEAGHSGIAHFLEHLMFKGSTGFAPGEFSKQVQRLGGQDNAFTTQNYTAYFQSVSADQLETVMRMEAGRMRGMNVPPGPFTSERDVIMEERRQRTDNSDAARFTEQMRAMAFVNHPYGTPVIGWMHEMAQLEWDKVKDFYDHWYGPNNAIVVISGDVTGEQALQLATQIYGPIPKVSVPERHWLKSPPLDSPITLRGNSMQQHQTDISILIRLPSAVQNQKLSLGLEIASEILGGGSSSRLYRALVVEQKLASAIGVSYDPTQRSDAEFWINAHAAPDVNADQLLNAIYQEINRFISDGPTDIEIAEAKRKLSDAAVFARDSLSGPAMIVGRSLAVGLPLEYVEYWPSLIEQTHDETITESARYLDWRAGSPLRNPAVIGIFEPSPTQGEQP